MNLFKFALAALTALVIAAFALRTPDTDPDTMLAKYTNSASRFVTSDDGRLRIHIRDQGTRFGIPIVLLHGSNASLHDWEPLIEHLKDEYRIITLTLPGHGLTGPHPDDKYNYTAMAEAVDVVVRDLQLNGFVLGGNSMGGWIAWRYALANPDPVRALLLFNAAGMPLRDGETAPPLNIGFRLARNEYGRKIIQTYTPRTIIKKSLQQTVADPAVVSNDMVDRYWELLRYPGNRRATALRADSDRQASYASLVREITAPTLILWGSEDKLIFPSAAKSFDERMSNADVIVYDNIGHLPMQEIPDRAALDIDAFLERTVKQRG